MGLLNDRIKERRRILGLKSDDVASAVGISRATLYRYEGGEINKIPTKILEPLSKVLQTTPEYLMGLDEKKGPWGEAFSSGVMPVTYLPVIGTVKAGAGGVIFEDVLGQEMVDNTLLQGHSPSEFCWVKIKDHSMEPRLAPGDLALIQKQAYIKSGTYAVVLIDGEEGSVKRVVYDDDSITLYAENPATPPISFQGKEILRVRIAGRLLRSIGLF